MTTHADTLATRVALWARRRPADTALSDRGVRTTWRELDAWADAIASRLAATGAPPGRVAVLAQDRVATIAAIVGVMRAGHAVVVVDTADPDERVRFIAADAEPAAIVAEAAQRERAAALAPAGCPLVGTEPPQAGDPAPPAAWPAVDVAAFGWFVYTSGSTGRAKGVLKTHRTILYFAELFASNLGIGAHDRLSMLYSCATGAGTAAIARGLALGLPLCLYDLRRDGVAGLADWLDRERVTFLQTFPRVGREMCEHIGAERVLPHLTVAQLGGEATYAEDFARLRAHTAPHCRFLHQLAATEISLVAQNVFAHDAPLTPGAPVPVGQPVAGVRIEIRRDDGSVADPGEAGEIVVFSRHVTPGYWHRPDLDARVFVPDPLDPESRGYRMGDFGCLHADGSLQFIGRVGTRVKIRGYTVDLGEVDGALLAWPHAARATSAALADPADVTQQRVVAFVEVRPGARRDPRALLLFLAEHLPHAMLPAEVRFVAAMPVTANGKIDRASLESAPVLPPERAAEDAPRDDVERAVARMFADLTRQECRSRDDDFFLVGGDSLLAADLQLRIKDAFGVRFRDFHAASSVATIAAWIRAAQGRPPDAQPMLMPLWREGSAVPMFMVHGRGGQAYVSPLFMRLLGNDQPVWAFQARGVDGLSTAHESIEELVQDYVEEVRRVRPHGPYFLAGLCVGGYIAGAIARELAAAGEQVLPLLLLDPPNRVVASDEYRDPELVRERMQMRRAQGKLIGTLDDADVMARTVEMTQRFNDACARYVPLPYHGAAYVLSSRDRVLDGDRDALQQAFAGPFKRYAVGHTHHHALDPRNPVFAAALKACVGVIQAAASRPPADAGPG